MGKRSHRLAAALGLVPYLEAAEQVAPAGGTTVALGLAGRGTLAAFTFPASGGIDKATALKVPALQRSHDLIVALVAGLPIVPYREVWNDEAGELEVVPVRPLPWHNRPDPIRTRQAFLGALASDLWAYGRAYVHVTARYQSRPENSEPAWPATFRWLPFDAITIDYADQDPRLGLAPGMRVMYHGHELRTADVLEVTNAATAVCAAGADAVRIARALDDAALRFSTVEMPSGWLEQVEGEPMSAGELSELAAGWSEARRQNTTGALNQYVKFHESTFDPDRLQLVESRTYEALDMARIGNVPPYLVGAPAGTGMTYQNGQQARQDLVDFGAAPIITAIEQALSGPNVSPAGQAVRLDTAAWLAHPAAGTGAPPAPAADTATAPEVPA